MKLKALNFLQLWHLIERDLELYRDWLMKALNQKQNNLSSWAYFLNQPFTPDLIEKYFEGWEFDIKFKIYQCNSYLIELNELNNHIELFTLQDKATFYSVNMRSAIPRTLDEFITLCQLAGVELNLKDSFQNGNSQ